MVGMVPAKMYIRDRCTAQELLEQIKTEKEKLVKDGKLKKSASTDSVIFKGDDNKYFEKIGKTITGYFFKLYLFKSFFTNLYTSGIDIPKSNGANKLSQSKFPTISK